MVRKRNPDAVKRPSGPTPEITKAICDNVRRGMHFGPAAELAGVDQRTFYHWRAKGELTRKGYEHYQEFVKQLKIAEAEVEMTALDSWMNGFDEDWKAAATFLSKRYPERWGEKAVVDAESASSITVVISRRKDDAEGSRTSVRVTES